MIFSSKNNQNKRILVCDDIVDNSLILEVILNAAGYTVDVAYSGKAALKKIENNIPDLLLLDFMMPGMNGYQVIKHIKQEGGKYSFPIILMSAHSPSDIGGECLKLIDGFVSKPLEIETLIKLIESLKLPTLSANSQS